jgi:hypothetical protein
MVIGSKNDETKLQILQIVACSCKLNDYILQDF